MSLNSLFSPKSVALIGASKDEGSVGNEIAKNLLTQGYKGKVFLTNPKGGKLYGHTILKETAKINVSPDLAIIAIPAKYVTAELKNLALLKTKSAVVISAGFGESGNNKDQDELVKICSGNNISLIGPNCIGLINPHIKLNASFAPLMPKKGDIAFISQSGALCASVLDFAAKIDLGFSKFISVGNKAQIGEAELLEYFHSDNKTKVIALYLEELDEANLIKKIVPSITGGKAKKPIVVLKAGRTEAGKKAAKSHTGSIGGSDSAYDALFSQTGIIRAETIEELFEIIETFSRNKPIKNDKIAVITNAGGPGVVTSDELTRAGLKLAKFSSSTQDKLKKILPVSATIKNPVDILGDADATRYKDTLDIVLSDKNVSALQVILTPQSMTQVKETAKAVRDAKKRFQKPILATFMGDSLVEAGVDFLNRNNIATSMFPELAAKALGALAFFSRNKYARAKEIRFTDVKPQTVREIINGIDTKQPKLLTMDLTYKVLRAYNFPLTKHYTVISEESARLLSKQLNEKLALRIISPQISHKTDVGGVLLNVDPAELSKAYKQIINTVKKNKPDAQIEGVDVSLMIKSGAIELILGAKSDPNLGKQILLGLGGIYTELIKDVSWGIAPLTNSDIERMLSTLRISKILSGYRGHPPLDIKTVKECTARLSQLVTDFPQIKEIDINPLMVLDKGQGALALDARILISDDMM